MIEEENEKWERFPGGMLYLLRCCTATAAAAVMRTFQLFAAEIGTLFSMWRAALYSTACCGLANKLAPSHLF
jgi:hypothetical protein